MGIYSIDSHDYGTKSSLLFSLLAKERGIHNLSVHPVDPRIKSDVSEAISDAAALGARVFLMLFSAADCIEVLREGTRAGLFHSGTQIIGGEAISIESDFNALNITTEERNLRTVLAMLRHH